MSSVLPDMVVHEHQRFLWGVAYRLTGSAADADDVVQETFVRALERPPADLERPWRPWLTRVAVNLAYDRLRARKRQSYTGPWLPSPAATARVVDDDAPDARYGQRESATMAFLMALEELTPRQRAVLVLRDVYDFSVQETADLLGTSCANIKVTLHRARKTLDAAGSQRRAPPPSVETKQRVQVALEHLFDALARRDMAAVTALLAEDVLCIHDGGGEYLAALRPVVGRDPVSRLYMGLVERIVGEVDVQWIDLNGHPALFVSLRDPEPRQAPRSVVQVDVDPQGRITQIRSILAPRKLTALVAR